MSIIKNNELLKLDLSDLAQWQLNILSEAQKYAVPLSSAISFDYNYLCNIISQAKIEEILLPKITIANDNNATIGSAHLIPAKERADKSKEESLINSLKIKIKLNASVLLEELASELTNELLSDIAEYNVPYDKDTCVIKLRDLIDEYKILLAQAASYFIDWDTSIFDLVGLRQEIESQIQKARREYQNLSRDYFDSRI